MLRRSFIKSLLGSLAFPLTTKAATSAKTLLLQKSPIAGFQYYEGDKVWPALSIGTPVIFHRETDNTHDRRAVAVYWNEHKLGYVPRAENSGAAQLLDGGHRLTGQIVGLRTDGGPWQRIRFSIHLTV